MIGVDRRATRSENRAGTVGDKVRAHERLRRVPDAYTPEMTKELIRIGLGDPSAKVRADVWRIFDGDSASKLLAIVPPLVQIVRNDVSGRVRSEACETLGNFANNAAALNALRFAARHDQDARVRIQATRSLFELGELLRRP